MRKYTIPQSMEVEYLFGDHLGSTSITTDSTGAKVSEMRYTAWGEVRYSWTSGQSTTPAYELTKYTFTGQFSDSYINLLWYNSRHYDPALGRFTQADTIVPSGVQGLDRYAYVNNNPIRFTDPGGHKCTPEDECATPHGDTNIPDSIDDDDPVNIPQNPNGYDGYDMYELYLFYFNQPGWWHTSSFDPDGHFSISDFLVLMVFFEMNGIGDQDPSAQDAYTIATAQNISFFCANNGGGTCSGISKNAILNYIAGRHVARNRYDAYQQYLMTGDLKDAGLGPIRNGVPFLDNNHDPSVARSVVENSIAKLSSKGSPWDYGNLSMFPQDVWNALFVAPTGCTEVKCVYWRSADNLAYVMTQDQINCWRFGQCEK